MAATGVGNSRSSPLTGGRFHSLLCPPLGTVGVPRSLGKFRWHLIGTELLVSGIVGGAGAASGRPPRRAESPGRGCGTPRQREPPLATLGTALTACPDAVHGHTCPGRGKSHPHGSVFLFSGPAGAGLPGPKRSATPVGHWRSAHHTASAVPRAGPWSQCLGHGRCPQITDEGTEAQRGTATCPG